MDFIAVIAVPFALALIIVLARRSVRTDHQGWILSAVLAASFALLLSRLPAVVEQGSLTYTTDWIPRLGLTLTLYIDGLAVFFGLIVTGVAAAVFLYAGYYFEDRRKASRFFALLLSFSGSMLLLVMAGNLLLLFIAWELTSIISFLLISFKGADAEARRGASQALIITGGGGLALLAGLLLIGGVTGSLDLATTLSSSEMLRESPLSAAILVLLLLGAFTKSAQAPFHFWLPGAMSAPTPASAFLHSATMVKAGLYLLLRFYPVFGGMELWTILLPIVGLATMLIGALIALRQQDLKGMLAYSTISQLGALVALIGQPNSAGLTAALVTILAHALYKCTLFLVAGAVDHATGTRNIHELGGLHRKMRGFAVVSALAGLSMAGVPPLLGFVAKEAMLEATLGSTAALIIVVTSAALTVTLALLFFSEIFLGRPRVPTPQPEHAEHDSHHPLGDDAYDANPFHRLPTLMVVGPAMLAGLSLAIGLGVEPLVNPLLSAALGAPVNLHLFPGYLSSAFILSLTALATGTVIFALRRFWMAWPLPTLVTGAGAYRRTLELVERSGDLLLRSQGGKIRFYLRAILSAVLLLLVPVFINYARQLGPGVASISINSAADLLKLILLGLALASTLMSILFERHLLAALSMGIAGYSIGGIFLLEPAPDVALVQFLVETLATVLIIVILARTSDSERRRAMARVWATSRAGKLGDLLIASGLGLAVTIFAVTAVSNRFIPGPASEWYLDHSLPEAGASDVVASIITDFRGSDTLIEITVFGMASLGVLALLARPKPGRVIRWGQRKPILLAAEPEPKDALQEDAERPETRVYASRVRDPVVQFAAVLIMPISLLIALAHLLYAGAAPGDGFTAGVIGGLAIALWYVAFGYEVTKERLRWLYPSLFIGTGLLIAYLNALAPLLFGRDFLALTVVPGFSFADIKLASSLLFEIGIALTVFGGISAIMEAITHPKEVEAL